MAGSVVRARGRVVVISDGAASTLADCLDGIADQLPAGTELFVVDRDSADASTEVAIHHPAVDRVVPVARAGAQLVLDAASADARHLVLIAGDRRPEPGWLAAALAALDGAAVAHGPDRTLENLAIDVGELRWIRLLAGAESLDEVLRRVTASGRAAVEVPAMRTVPAEPVGPRIGLRPVQEVRPDGPRWTGTISVVVCTRDRMSPLHRCLVSLRALVDDDHEIVVVDNHPEPTVAAADLPPRSRLVHEPRSGLDVARNRGAAEAVGQVVAYVDDDCEVDPHWLLALRCAFADPAVGLVTGRVRPASLARPTHRQFESYFGFDRGLVRRRFTPWDDRPWFPLWTGPMGTGCNMAVRRGVLEAVDGFDERLDVGTTIGGGGDLDLFARVLHAGTVAEYAPDALVWHHHRDDARALARQFRGYGQASGGYLAKVVLEQPGRRGTAARCYVDRIVRRMRTARRIRSGQHLLPMHLLLIDLAGHLSGPLLLLRAGRHARRR